MYVLLQPPVQWQIVYEHTRYVSGPSVVLQTDISHNLIQFFHPKAISEKTLLKKFKLIYSAV